MHSTYIRAVRTLGDFIITNLYTRFYLSSDISTACFFIYCIYIYCIYIYMCV